MWGSRDSLADIFPGGQLGGFNITSSGLPSIYGFYARGFSETPILEGEPDSLVGSNVFENSFKGRTIAPKDPPTPFNGLNSLDTIKSYINQSRSLGWITNQTIADKYARLVDSAHSNLQANNRGVTKAKLDSVLLNANTDSASTLTSEAYALLRFNTEYVMKKLREEDSAFAAANKSSSWDATATNNARHLAKSPTGQAGSYLHEIFVSGGELFYRRSTDGGSTWDQTHQINSAVGDNARPCIAITQTPAIQIVWQRRIAPSTYEVWHSYSQNDGVTWSTPAILPGAAGVTVSGYQTDGPTPVIAEMFGKQRVLVVVYSSVEGLWYKTSQDDGKNWQTGDTISGQYDDRVRFPTLAGADSYMSLLYDYAGDDLSPYSRIFGGSSWSSENSVGKSTGSTQGTFSSVAIDADKNPIAAWSGIANTWTRSVIFRAGYSDNTWSSWFEEFGQGQFGPDWLNPSLTYYSREGGQYGVAIVNHTSSNDVKLIRYDASGAEPPWSISTLSTSGAWANITQETSSSGNPLHCWTDQSAFPHEIVVARQTDVGLGSSGGLSPQRGGRPAKAGMVETANPLGFAWKRRAVVYHRDLRATLALGFESMKIVTTSGDTTLTAFKHASLREPGITLVNMWDYLGSAVVSLPADARRLVVTKQFALRGPSIAQRKFFLHVLNTDGIPIGLLDTSSSSGTVSVNIRPYAGMNVIFRPQVVLVGIDPPSVNIGVGDVFIMPDTRSNPARQRKK